MLNNNKFNRINFNHSDRERIINAVIRKLGLKNKFELNDRMEGVMFLDKHIRRVFSSLVVEKEYDKILSSKERPLRCSDEFIHKYLKHKLVFPNSNGLININGNDFEILIVVVIDDSYKSGFIKKIFTRDLIINKLNDRRGKTTSLSIDSL